MSTYTFTCRQLFNVFGVRSIPNTGDEGRHYKGAMSA